MKKYVYELTFYKIYEEGRDGFEIGFFSSRDKAKEVQEYYATNVLGFKDTLNGEYEIKEIEIEKTNSTNKYYYIEAWNEDEFDFDVDMVMSKIYPTEEEAKKDYNQFVALHKRQQCVLTFFEVDHCDWEEGFVTYYN